VKKMLLAWLWLSSVASAQGLGGAEDDERAREFFISGQALYQEGRYRDALVAFETAYRKSSRPAILRSIAYCHEKLGELDSALAVLRRYRGLAPEEKLPAIDRAIRRIESQLVAAVETELEQAEPEFVEESPPPQPVYEEPPRWKVGAGPVVLYSLAGAGAVVGTVFALNASRARLETAALCSQGDAIFCRDTAATYINQDWLYSLIADTGFGVAGVAAVGGTVWMVLDNSNPNQVSVGAGLNGIHVRGRF